MTPTMLADRALIRLAGEDVRGFLQGLVTNDVTGPLPVWAGLLTPQGKALFDFIVWAEGDDLLIDAEAEQAEALVRRLTLYRLRRAITIGREQELAVHWSATLPPEGEGAAAATDPRLAALGHRWLARPADPAADWHAHRLSHGVVEGIAELGSGDTLWLECNAAELNGVSFAKGCYVGQENTARMHYRSRVNRRLVVEPLTATDDPRVRTRYPALGRQVAHRRVEDIDPAAVPLWLADGMATAGGPETA